MLVEFIGYVESQAGANVTVVYDGAEHVLKPGERSPLTWRYPLVRLPLPADVRFVKIAETVVPMPTTPVLERGDQVKVKRANGSLDVFTVEAFITFVQAYFGHAAQGPRGFRGEQGAQGEEGPRGPQGERGPQGAPIPDDEIEAFVQSFVRQKEFSTHLSAENPHNVSKGQIGLGRVDNTTDAEKPVSTAQAKAISDAVAPATKDEVWAGTVGAKPVTPAVLKAAQELQPVTPALGLAAIDLDKGINFSITRAGTVALPQPKGLKALWSGSIRLDGPGTVILSRAWDLGGTVPDWSAVAGTFDWLDYQVVNPAGGDGCVRASFRKALALPALTAWSSTDKNAAWTLSGSDLVATRTSNTAATLGRSSTYRSAGKVYAELRAGSGSDTRVGLANASASLAGGPGTDANSIGFQANTGQISFNGAAQIAGTLPVNTGGVLGIAVDFDARTVTWYVNGLVMYTSTSIPTGALALAYGSTITGTGHTWTINSGRSALVYPIPDGFVAWDF